MAPNKRSTINHRRSSSLKCLGCTSMPSGTISSTFEQPQFCIAFFDVFYQSMHILFDKRLSTENIGVHNSPPIPCYNHDNRQAKLSTDSLREDFDVRAQVMTSISESDLHHHVFQRTYAEHWSRVADGCPHSKLFWRKLDTLLQPDTVIIWPTVANVFNIFFAPRLTLHDHQLPVHPLR